MPFLDCLLTIKDHKLQIKVYQKNTHTNQYLAFDSNHPLIHKLGVIRTLQFRANTIISEPAEIDKEHLSIKEALRCNGYPEWSFTKAQQHPRQTQTSTADQPRGRRSQVIIPYVRGASERLQKSFKKQGINTIYKPFNNLRSKLVKVKDRAPKDTQSNLIYNFSCPHSEWMPSDIYWWN